MYVPPSFLPSSFKGMITYVPHTVLMIHKPPEIGCKILDVCLFLFSMRSVHFFMFLKVFLTLNILKPLQAPWLKPTLTPTIKDSLLGPQSTLVTNNIIKSLIDKWDLRTYSISFVLEYF